MPEIIHEERQEDNADLYLHLKEVEISFKEGSPKEDFVVILDVQGDRTYKSDVFARPDVIKWRKGIYLRPTATAKLVLKVVFGTNMKMTIPKRKSFAQATVDLKEYREVAGESREVSIEGHPRVAMKITFGDPLPVETIVRLLGGETMSAMESKVKLLEKSKTVLSVSELVLKLVGAAGQVVPGANTIVPIAQVIFDRCKNLNEANQTAVVMMDNINAFMPLVIQLQHSIEEPQAQQHLSSLLRLIKDIVDVLFDYSKHSNTSFYVRHWISSKKETFDVLKGRVDAMKDSITLYLQTKTYKNTADIRDDQLLHKLCPVSKAVYYDPERGCLEGTREKFVSNALEKLKSESNDYIVCWVRGPAGIGKTTISISLAEIFKKDSLLGGCFIFDRNIPDQREPRNVLPTLAHSLALSYPPYRKYVLSVLGKDPEIAKKSPQDQLAALFPPDIKVATPKSPFVLIVDALDECALDEKLESKGASDRAAIAVRLVEMAKNIPWLRIVITGRPTTEILEVFGEDGSKGDDGQRNLQVTTLDLTAVDSSDVRADIYNFNKAWLESVRGLGEKWTKHDDIQKLTERANGLFIWSSTVRDYVKRAFDRNIALEQIMDQTETHVDGPFSTLDKLYQFVLKQAGGSDQIQVLRRALGVLASVAKNRPLTPEAFFELLSPKSLNEGLSKPALQNIFDRLQSVLYIDENGVVRVCHPSFLDFLNSKDRAGDYWIEPSSINGDLFQQCMLLMKRGLRFNICQVDSAYVFNSDVPDLQAKIYAKIPESLRYSCVHWIDHLLSAYLKGALVQDASIQAMIYDFLCSVKSLFWLEVMSLIKELKAAINALSHCFRAFDDMEPLVSTSRDLFRFTTTFYDAIANSTPHIYISALSWAPLESYLSINMAPKFLHQPATMISGTARQWNPILWSTTSPYYFKSASFSQDGSHLITFVTNHDGEQRSIILWDTQTGENKGELQGILTDAQFSFDSKNVYTRVNGGVLASWNLATRKLTPVTLKGVYRVSRFRLSPVKNEIALLLRWGLCIYDLSTGKRKLDPVDLENSASCINYSPKGECIAVGFNDGSIRVVNSSDGVLKGYTLVSSKSRCIMNLIFSPDCNSLCSYSEDNGISSLWNVHTGRLIKKLVHTATISSMTYTPDSRFIISAENDGGICFWKFTGEIGEVMMYKLTRSYGINPHIDCSPDGRYFVTCSDSKDLRMWSIPDTVREMEQLHDLRTRHTSSVTSIDCSPNGIIISGSVDRSLFLWDLETGNRSGEPILGIHAFAQFSPNGDQIVSCSGSAFVIVWDAITRERCMTVGSIEDGGYKFCFYSWDGRHIVALTKRGMVATWDSSSGERLSCSGNSSSQKEHEEKEEKKKEDGDKEGSEDEFEGLSNISALDPADATISPTTNHFIFMDNDNMVHYIYDFLEGKVIFTIHTEWVYSFSIYSPDGKEIARVEKNTIFFYDALTGTALSDPISLDIVPITEFIYSPDGKYLILATANHEILIFEKKLRKLVFGPIRGHTNPIPRMKFSRHNGKYLITGAGDDTVRIWDMEFIMKTFGREANSVINIYEDGSYSIGTGLAATADGSKAISRRILPQSIMKDGWYRNTKGELLFWIPPEYRIDAVDMSKICIPATARRELNYDFERLSRYEGSNWVKIFSD